jgi:hypothetical protein
MKRTLTIMGVAVAALTVVYGCLMILTVMARDRVESAVSFENVKAIQLDLGAGSLTLTGTDSEGITGTRTTVRSVARPHIKERLDGDGTLHLSTYCAWFASFNCSASYNLNVPKDVVVSGSSSGGSLSFQAIDGEIDVSSSGGGVRASHVGGKLTADSSGGGISVTHSSGALKLDSSGGGISVTDSSGSVHASSSGGGIQLGRSTSTDVDLSSSGGGVRATFTKPPKRVRISSSGGGVRLILPRGEISYAVDASSSGGSTSVKIRTDPEAEYTVRLRSSGGSVSATYAEPAGT